MKKLLFAITIALTSLFTAAPEASAAVGNPYWGYTGNATLICYDGIYYGFVCCGMAQGEGYFYFYDGSVFHGNFNCGLPHGQGEVLTSQGYIAGIWNNGNFVRTTTVPQYQVQNYYNVAQNNYNTTPQVRNNYRQNSSNSNFALSDYKIEDVSNTSFGKQLMGKMSGR